MTSFPPKISVITVVLNAAAELEKTICSVTGQVYPGIEFIVVDGGSTDGTLEVIRSNAERINCRISEPDRGPYDAMNKGLAIATGEWVIFMNAGDLFDGEDAISKAFAGDVSEYGVVYGNVIACYSQSRVIKVAGSPEELAKGMIFCHQSAFVRTSLARENGFDLQFPLGADFDMMFRLYAAGIKFKRLPFPVAVIDVNGMSNRRMVQSALEHYKIVRKYRKTGLGEHIFHAGFICWVSVISLGYRILPVSVMHRISNFVTKSGQRSKKTDNL